MEDGVMTLSADGLREAFAVDFAEQILETVNVSDCSIKRSVCQGQIVSLKLIF